MGNARRTKANSWDPKVGPMGPSLGMTKLRDE
jgi:hypothetical protein